MRVKLNENLFFEMIVVTSKSSLILTFGLIYDKILAF
jgi:hypothetical protein